MTESGSGTTIYAPGVRPPDYRDYMWLYTEGEEVNCVVDGAPVGPTGRLFTVRPKKAVRVPWEAGRFILEHLPYTGVVRVNEVDREDGTGTDLDLPAAKVESLARFQSEDERRWRDYVQYVITDKIDNKRVIPPPPDAIRRIMDRRGFRLEDFGINVPGVESASRTSNAQMAALKEQNDSLQGQVAALTARLNDALGEPDGADGADAPKDKSKKKG